MPRPPRDYGLALREDIKKLDQKIHALAVERARKERMLIEYNRSVDIDIEAVVRASLVSSSKATTTTPRKAPQKQGRRR